MKDRINACLIHLLISMLIVSAVLAIVILVWYPHPYFEAMAVSRILMILAMVDVTIGPMLTFIVFDRAKASLKFDLGVIAGLQMLALIYGVATVFVARPVYMVFNVDIFTLVSAVDIPKDELAMAGNLRLPLSGPQLVGARLPEDGKERERILFSALNHGIDLPQMPRYYRPYATMVNDVRSRLRPLDALLDRPSKKANGIQAAIFSVLTERGLQVADVGYLPLVARAKNLTILIRRSDAGIVAILPVDP